MNYDEIYKKNKDAWGKAPNKCLQMVWQKLDAGAEFLDLGCGQGRDSIFMAKQGFKVTAVDNSAEGIKSLADLAVELGLENINAVCQNVAEFEIEKDKYSAVSVVNLFHFMKKDQALLIVEKIKNSLKVNGFIVILGFTTQDPGFSSGSKSDFGYFSPKELLALFSGYRVVMHEEGIMHDAGHPGFEQPHDHGFVRFTGQKL